MPRMTSESFGAGDTTWLGSNHGLYNARTLTLDPAKFSDIQAEKGKVPSGQPVAVLDDGTIEPYTGAGTFAGHVLFDQDASKGEVGVAVMYHGTVITERVPVEGFTAPTAQTASSIVYL